MSRASGAAARIVGSKELDVERVSGRVLYFKPESMFALDDPLGSVLADLGAPSDCRIRVTVEVLDDRSGS